MQDHVDMGGLDLPPAGVDSPSHARLGQALQKRVSEASYLVAQNYERYRPTMRYFYDQHMAHQYSLSLEDVFTHMRAFVSAAYTEEQCEQDLQQLCEWGNLTAEQDRSRARTVEEFLRRRLRYTITAYGIAFERLLIQLEQGGAAGGSLDPSLLESLAECLHRLERVARDPALDVFVDQGERGQPPTGNRGSHDGEATARALEAYNLWTRAYETFDKIGRQASDYLGELHTGEQEDFADIEVFVAYKDVLLQYLNTFVTGLYDVGERIAGQVRGMTKDGVSERLARVLGWYESRHLPSAQGLLPDAAAVRARRSGEWHALERWFESRGGLETLRRRTTGAIERVVRQSQRVMDRRSGLSRRRELEQLALRFAGIEEIDEAHRLAAAAWGCAVPRHISGSAEVFAFDASEPVWQQEPQSLALQSIHVSSGAGRRRSAPVADDNERQRRALEDEIERRRQERVIWDALFADGDLDLGDLRLEGPELRARLLSILSQCLASPDRSAHAPDGSTIRLMSPPEAGADAENVGFLTAPDGTLALPRFRLRRVTARAGTIRQEIRSGEAAMAEIVAAREGGSA